MSTTIAPTAWTLAPTGTPPTPIRSKRDRIDRWWGPILAVQALLTFVVLAAAVFIGAVGGGVLVAGPILVGSFQVLQLCLCAYTWGSLRSLDTPLEVSDTGLLLRSPRGIVDAPWSAVESVRLVGAFGGPQLQVRLVPGFGPGHAPTATLTPGAWRMAHRQGLRYAVRMLEVDADQLRTLVQQRSAGRVVVTR